MEHMVVRTEDSVSRPESIATVECWKDTITDIERMSWNPRPPGQWAAEDTGTQWNRWPERYKWN